jgi:DNA invertase Pin-like site-specific DNA recombinase
MNTLHLNDLAIKTRRGLEGRVREGRSGGGISYGYALVAGDVGARRINPAEADVVRRIFRDYGSIRRSTLEETILGALKTQLMAPELVQGRPS